MAKWKLFGGKPYGWDGSSRREWNMKMSYRGPYVGHGFCGDHPNFSTASEINEAVENHKAKSRKTFSGWVK